jgi:hypothetical protein
VQQVTLSSREAGRKYMVDKRPAPQGEKPRSEPEIIPPEHTRARTAQGTPRMRIFVDTRGTEHVYVARLRPLGIILVALTTGILLAVMLILLLSAFLIWIPVIVLLVTDRYYCRAIAWIF